MLYKKNINYIKLKQKKNIKNNEHATRKQQQISLIILYILDYSQKFLRALTFFLNMLNIVFLPKKLYKFYCLKTYKYSLF